MDKIEPKREGNVRSYEYVHKDIDILNIVEKIQEMEKLKILLFTEDQRKLFLLMTKPILSSENVQSETGNKLFLTLKNMRESTNLKDLQQFYLKIKEEGKKASEINQRSVEMIDAVKN